MFDNTLLESSPKQAPVLNKGHYFFTTGCGLLTFLLTFFFLHWLFPAGPVRVLFIQALVAGVLATAWAIMLCYVHADARHLGLNPVLWLITTLVLNVAGFLGYLAYSAARAGNWRRVAIPCAYIFEVILVGAMALVPLIYTDALPKMGETITVPPVPPPAAPAQVAPREFRKTSSQNQRMDALLRVPPTIPTSVRIVRDEPLPPTDPTSGTTGVRGGIPGISDGTDNVLRRVIESAARLPAAPPKREADNPSGFAWAESWSPPNSSINPNRVILRWPE